MSKWAKFYSAHSPLQITKVNKGEGIRLGEDWGRAVTSTADPKQLMQILIDGKPITQYAQKYNGLQKIEDIEKFFKEVILEKMQTLKPEDEAEIISFLKQTFHQGGLMHPVSGALATSMEREALPGEVIGVRDGKVAYATIADMDKVVDIIPTKEGFNVKEYIGVNKIIVSENGFEKYGIQYAEQRTNDGQTYKMADNPCIAREDAGKIIEAQGEIAVNLLNPKKPKISIESNAINYGDPRLEEALHSHSLVQWIIDFIKNTFGYNKVEILERATIEPSKEETDEYQNGPKFM